MADGWFHIGEVARRTEVSPALLRAWETRYGLIDPQRSPGGTRLYSAEDLRRIHAMKTHLAAGLSAAQAARAALGTPPGPPEAPYAPPPAEAEEPESNELRDGADQLSAAFRRLDSQAAEYAFERLLANFSFETLARQVLLPYLAEVGGRWSRGEATVAEEHLASNILRARLLALGGAWSATAGGRAVLACPPEERHDLALVMLAVAMRRRGWQVTLLGADTPIVTVSEAAGLCRADLIALAATAEARFSAAAGELAELASRHTVFLAGAGATPAVGAQVGALRLQGDPITALEELEPFRFNAS